MTIKKRFFRLASLLFLFALSIPARSHAHPISISDAYVEIKKDKLEIRLEVYVEDLYLFHELKLNDEQMLPLSEVKRAAKLHKSFLQERFKILDKQGARLPLKFIKRDDDDLPDEDIPVVHLMFFKLVYKYEVDLETQPKFLTFLQEFTHEKMILPAEVSLKVKPSNGSRRQKVLLPNQPWTVRFDTKENLSKKTENLTPKQRLEKERNQTLGITSYGETYAFLYLEPEETRLEILIPLATIAASLDLELKPDGILDLEDQKKLQEPIQKLLREKIELHFDRKQREPARGTLKFFGVAIRDLSGKFIPENVSIANARVGIILPFPHPPGAKTGHLKWNLFNQFLYQINLAIIEGENTKKETLRKIGTKNEQTWKIPSQLSQVTLKDIAKKVEQKNRVVFNNQKSKKFNSAHLISIFLTLVILVLVFPVIWRMLRKNVEKISPSAVQVAGFFFILFFIGTLWWRSSVIEHSLKIKMKHQAEPFFQENDFSSFTNLMLTEIYTAFNQRDEKSIYAQLDHVVDGSLLRTFYLEIRKSMTIEEQGGAIARAGEVKLLSCKPAKNFKSFVLPEKKKNIQIDYRLGHIQTFLCEWEVPGSVEHWGHIHQRTTSYKALLSLAPRKVKSGNYHWKLIDAKLLNQNQTGIKTSVRKF